tara:strand:- start:204 stop:365 length:162 start_codon:yes stop_codon:yes gene_type:complete
VKKVLETLIDEDLGDLKFEVEQATKDVKDIEDVIESLKNQIPFYKKKLNNRKE